METPTPTNIIECVSCHKDIDSNGSKGIYGGFPWHVKCRIAAAKTAADPFADLDTPTNDGWDAS